MLLQGQVAGVSVMAVSGRPGEAAKVRIRGTNTISGDADLYGWWMVYLYSRMSRIFRQGRLNLVIE